MQLDRAGDIWFDGEFVPWGSATVHVSTHALHYGSSVFEGLRAYARPDGPAVLGLEEHVRRLFDSCKVVGMEIPFEPAAVSAAVCETVARGGHEACYVRPLVFRGAGTLGVDPTGNPVHVCVAAFPVGRYFGEEAVEHGIDVGVSSWRRMAPDTHPAMVKSAANYLNSQLILLEAKRHGYTEGLALDVDGFVCEASGMNVFVGLQGRLVTPPLADSILGGVTRSYVLQLARDLGIECVEQRVSREMLHFADEVFLTGTAAEITPVRSVDARPVGAGSRGPLTERLQREFFGIVRGEVHDRHGWLTPARSG